MNTARIEVGSYTVAWNETKAPSGWDIQQYGEWLSDLGFFSLSQAIDRAGQFYADDMQALVNPPIGEALDIE